MVDRIKQIMDFYKLSPALFAEQIGINRSNLTHLFSGRNQPSLELAKKILQSYPEIKTEWLIMGMGEMLRSIEDKEFTMKVQHEKTLHPELSEPNLFSNPPLQQLHVNTITGESAVVEKNEIKSEILNSREVDKGVKKIVFFYSDSSFEIYHPNK